MVPTLRNWTVIPSGGAMTVDGVDITTGQPTKLRSVRTVKHEVVDRGRFRAVGSQVAARNGNGELEASASHAMRVGAFATAYRAQAEIERRRLAA